MTLLAAAARAAAVPPFRAMAMARMASELESSGRRVLHLEVGQPATGAPALAREAVTGLLADAAPMGYTNAPGLPSLRRAIAAHYLDWYAVDVDPASILAVAGASAGFTLAFLAAFDAGDRVGVLEPGYPCYRNALLALGIEPVAIPVGPDTRWAPTADLLDAAGPLRGLVVASPSNPTGTVLSHEQQSSIAAWCAGRGVQLIADEIYHGISYTGPAATMLAVTPHAVVVNSFSKYFSMTGWRLGWMVVPDHLRDAVERLQQNVYICAPHISQVAGVAALRASAELDAHVARYARNRLLLVDGLAAAGIHRIAEADGAFYVYADIAHLGLDASVLCPRWLDELGLATTPGLDFDLARGEQFVRFSYAGPTDDIAAACDALGSWSP